MIKSLNVENFQSHKKSKLEFSAGVNALTGTSDAGKSGLFRAMVWVLTNRPRGEAFRSDWGGFTHVSIVTDSYFIGRGRDGKENAYELRNDEEDIDLYFKAIKGDVPDEVAQALNISSINIQSQHQPHFLLSDTPGKVAEHFSSVANLSQISSTIKWIQKGLRRVTTEEETYTTREGELKDSLKEFEQLEEFEKLVTRFEELELKKQQILTDTEKLSTLRNQIGNTQEALKNIKPPDGLKEQVDETVILFGEKRMLHARIKSLKQIISAIKTTKQAHSKAIQKGTELQTRFDESFPDVCPLCGQGVEGQ